ncbi:MAG: hypothetical protein II982_00050 [Clostridia bacterium]|nr:hypothetical protein [Clostridia bacterium]
MFEIINTNDLDNYGVVSAKSVLNGTAEENKQVFDRAAKELLIPAFNALAGDCKNMHETVSEIVENLNDTHDGMKKIGEIMLDDVKNKIVLQNISAVRGHVKLTYPAETREVSGKPIGYIFDADGYARAVTAYASGIGQGVNACFIIDFEVFSTVAKTLSFAVFASGNVGDKTSVTETAGAINIGGAVTGVQFYFENGFPIGTKLEVWGE